MPTRRASTGRISAIGRGRASPMSNSLDEGDEIILALNSGSSSLKFGVFRREAEDEELVFSGCADGISYADGGISLSAADGQVLLQEDHVLESQTDALTKVERALADRLKQPPVAVGHRVVHGGPKLRTHQLLSHEVLEELRRATHFAPLHIPPALALIEQARQVFPACPHFACFDTAFHRTMPEVAQHLPLPSRYFEQGVMRYG